MDNLGERLMAGTTSWIPEAAPSECSWLNPNARGKGGVGIILANKYAKLVTNIAHYVRIGLYGSNL